jgi:hypothetical protein
MDISQLVSYITLNMTKESFVVWAVPMAKYLRKSGRPRWVAVALLESVCESGLPNADIWQSSLERRRSGRHASVSTRHLQTNQNKSFTMTRARTLQVYA